MFINIYLSAYSVDKATRLNTPGPWWGCAAVAVAAMLLEDMPLMLNVVEVVPCPCSTLGTVPCPLSSRDSPWDPHPRRRLGTRDADNFPSTVPGAAWRLPGLAQPSGCCCG